jgi:cytochrome c peroxidase
VQAPKWFSVLLAAAVLPCIAYGAETLSLERMKALYQRPTSIPFPAANPYSAEKVALFRSAPLRRQLHLLRQLPQSGALLGRRLAARHRPRHDRARPAHPHRPQRGLGGSADVGRPQGQSRGAGAGADVGAQQLDKLPAKLAAIDGYRERFDAVFPGEGITVATAAKAIATYERTIVSGIAPFDRWIAGDEKAISESAKRGFVVFNTKGNCQACHSGWNFTDNSFRDIGLPDADIGRGKILDLPSMQHAFKTPTLRDIERRAPYMHDGSVPTLLAVVEHYDHGFVQRPSLSEEVKPLHLTAEEKTDLVNFMMTLTGENPPVHVPVLFAGPQTAQR